MSEEVGRRFASQIEAVNYALDNGSSVDEVAVSARLNGFDEQETVALFRARAMRRGVLAPAKGRAELEREEIAALLAAKLKPAEATQPEPQPEEAPPAPKPAKEEEGWRRIGRRSSVVIEGKVEKSEEDFLRPPMQPEVVPQPAPEGSRELVVTKPTLSGVLSEVACEVDHAESLAGTAKIVDYATVLSLMNEQHSVIGNYGGKCRVLEWVPSELDPDALVAVFQTKSDFIARYSNRQLGWKMGKPITLGQWWFEHPRRSGYRGVVFKPAKPAVITRGDRGGLSRTSGKATGRSAAQRSMASDAGLHVEQILSAGDHEKAADYNIKWIAGATNTRMSRPKLQTYFVDRKEEGKKYSAWSAQSGAPNGPHGIQINHAMHLTWASKRSTLSSVVS